MKPTKPVDRELDSAVTAALAEALRGMLTMIKRIPPQCLPPTLTPYENAAVSALAKFDDGKNEA